MTIYAALAQSILPILPQFAVGGPSFTGTRAASGTPAAAPTVTSLSARTIYFIPAKIEDFRAAFPDVDVFGTPYYGFAASGTDIVSGDSYTDGSYTYTITGKPATWYGFVLAPAGRL